MPKNPHLSRKLYLKFLNNLQSTPNRSDWANYFRDSHRLFQRVAVDSYQYAQPRGRTPFPGGADRSEPGFPF
jgi:hypothetical protein